MKSKYKLLAYALLVTIFLCGCSVVNSDMYAINDTVCIDNYIFCVEEAVGDRYNVRVRYSLKRQDGSEIDPEVHFGLLRSDDGLRSVGGNVQYSLSDDKKTIWIEEERSSSRKFDGNAIHTVTLEKLLFGEGSTLKPIEGKWSATYRVQIHEDYTELLADELKVRALDEKNYYLISSIQISQMGVHMEMKIPNNNINEFADSFEANLILQDGAIIELELHHSIRGKNAPFYATGETMFGKSIKLDELYAIVVCGQEILIS